ncbi:MAG: UPF0058 family protein [Methanoculleaceae archaeon]
MHKDELISLHSMLAEIKDYYEALNPDYKFTEYYSLNINPRDTNKSKTEHKYAIFVLGAELAEIMRERDFGGSGRISARMRELVEKTVRNLEYVH